MVRCLFGNWHHAARHITVRVPQECTAVAATWPSKMFLVLYQTIEYHFREHTTNLYIPLYFLSVNLRASAILCILQKANWIVKEEGNPRVWQSFSKMFSLNIWKHLEHLESSIQFSIICSTVWHHYFGMSLRNILGLKWGKWSGGEFGSCVKITIFLCG